MKLTRLIPFILLVASNVNAEDTTSRPNYYQDIRPIIENNCIGCHSEKGVSFTFEDPENAYLFHSAMNSAVQDRRMPPWLAKDGYQDYRGDTSLSESEIGLFEKWAESGYPKGSRSSRVLSPPKLTQEFKTDLTLNVSKSPYLPKQDQKDDYHCFIIDWPEQKDTYITGFRADPGNLKVAHHIVLFIAQPEITDIIKAFDESAKGEGYPCLAGIVPDGLGDKENNTKFEKAHPGGIKDTFQKSSWLAQWAPGTDGYNFPDGTGISIQKGSLIVAQVHYYSGFAPGERDQDSKVSFTLSETVSRPAIYIPFTNKTWLEGKKDNTMAIPAKQQRTFEASAPIGLIAAYTATTIGADKDKIKRISLHSSNIHMHSYGASAKSELTYKNGEKDILLSIPRWDIGWQRDFTFSEKKSFTKEQFKNIQYSVECTFSNYSNETIYGGYGSNDEMCFDFIYVSIEMEDGEVEKSEAGNNKTKK